MLEVVRDHGAFLVEDDWAHDLAITAQAPIPIARSDDSGHVLYLRSLTKSVSPAIRVAALVARGPSRERILADRLAESISQRPAAVRGARRRHPARVADHI